VRNVICDGAAGEHELIGNLLIGIATRDELGDFELAGGEHVQRRLRERHWRRFGGGVAIDNLHHPNLTACPR